MAAPMQSEVVMNTGFYQQQLMQTQNMFIEQQRMLNSLSASMDKMKRERRKRKVFIPQPSTSEISDVDTEDDNSSGSEPGYNHESGELDSSSDEDCASTVSKKIKLTSSKTISDKKKDKLKSIEKCFGKATCHGPPVDSELAKMVNKGLGSVLDHKTEGLKELLNKYERPENCEYLEVPKVAKSIWTSRDTGKEIKDSDKLFQRTQTYLTKGLMPLVQIMHKTINSESEEQEEIFDLALDSFTLLAHAHKDLSCQRKRLLIPAISSQYKALCGDNKSITATELFGEDLSEQIKKIEETGKITNKLTNKGKSKSNKQERKYTDSAKPRQFFKNYGKGQSNYRQNSFLYKKGPRAQQKPYKKDSPGRQHQK